jgi:hypothetical protein
VGDVIKLNTEIVGEVVLESTVEDPKEGAISDSVAVKSPINDTIRLKIPIPEEDDNGIGI